ncbi:MAG: UDP-N-acetylmuramoyl-L-alanyl-D-glutamate--2,6-diaminopimelate ligase [Caldithrix sp.]|nr:UDP-N-acetylmuramoyl-L-alanyl-D-glutamate--2,6-diaminopimelate ligase [Caldithrix sp.]
MINKTAEDLFVNLNIDFPEELGKLLIQGITYDSRKVQTGFLFVAIPGFETDGHTYVAQAAENGAIAAVVEARLPQVNIPQILVKNSRKILPWLVKNFYSPQIDNMKLTGVTGTNGKTTTAFLLHCMFQTAGWSTGLISTVHYQYGDDEPQPAWNTTPESSDLSAMLSDMRKKDIDCAVLEVSSHALELNRVDGLSFETAIFTNLSRDHLDFHATESAYFEAKARLFNLLKPMGKAVINIDDDYGQKLLQRVEKDIITFGMDHKAQVFPLDWHFDINGIEVKLQTPAGKTELHSALISEFNLQNILAAVSAGLASDIDLQTIARGIANLQGVPGRLEKIEVAPQTLAVIDYSHTPDALNKALQALRRITPGRLFVLFGAGGDRDKGKRPEMGRVAEEQADFSIVTSDNPRRESPDAIIRDILQGMPQSEKRMVIPNRREAIQKAVTMLDKGDVLLLAGKGHETYQDIDGHKFDFDERVIIKEAVGNDAH